MQPKTKNATFATPSNPYQNIRYNSQRNASVDMTFAFFFYIEIDLNLSFNSKKHITYLILFFNEIKNQN